MKLRRAMAAAAATAVIAPLALLSAPAAFADETSPTPTETVSETPSETPSDTTSPTAPTEVPSDTASPTDTTSPTASTEPTGTTSPTDSASPTDSTEPSESAEPSEDPSDPDVPYCDELDEDFTDAKVAADIKGLPGKIVAGDGFHTFKLVVTNESDTTVDGVAFYAEIENYEVDEAKWLSPYVDLEFKNPDTGSWDRIGNDDFAGDYFFYVDELKAGKSKSVDLRVSIDAKAPAGDAYSFGSGAYLDNVDGQDCIAEGWAQYDFSVLKAGSKNDDPGEATPSDNDKGSVKKPQGDVSELPTGNLAETGSSSALPTIGLVGGVAIVAGAGAVFAVRRRKAGTQA
ncbi:LPXTG-motif cell wall-anchored protein [Streptomyces sp. TLI_55]|uniref:LAETG motif-containing sortase-dependent surface protein n=1 Tax=Streptomyces sp. TLI_55 TaxID=1938861 RepID=UPI000BC8C494|nr:LAETG motif-containing sortase-dependent surface protein [Streptomyces sp. TLI_55]SNX63452.1 LPXTG-motif cell wall-anchored protein [Streptomyces sp. TLI_55]